MQCPIKKHAIDDNLGKPLPCMQHMDQSNRYNQIHTKISTFHTILNIYYYVTKVDMSKLVTCFNWTHVFEWYVVWFQERYQKDSCLKDIGLHA